MAAKKENKGQGRNGRGRRRVKSGWNALFARADPRPHISTAFILHSPASPNLTESIWLSLSSILVRLLLHQHSFNTISSSHALSVVFRSRPLSSRRPVFTRVSSVTAAPRHCYSTRRACHSSRPFHPSRTTLLIDVSIIATGERSIQRSYGSPRKHPCPLKPAYLRTIESSHPPTLAP